MSQANSNTGLDRSEQDSVRESLRWGLGRSVPANLTVLHYVGGLILFFLGLQVLTGLLLLVYYRPTAGEAFTSVAVITDEVRLGWLVRALHARGTDLLLVLCMLHMYRVYVSRAYQPPRQLNWIIGALLLLFLIAMGFTGIILPWDQYGYWSTASAQETITRIPVIGNILLGLLWGGWEMGSEVLLRFYAFHVGVLPWLASGLLLLHVSMIWRLGIKAPAQGLEPNTPTRFFPDLTLNLLIACLLIGGILLTAAMVFPPQLWQEADPLTVPAQVQPPWYLLPLRGLLLSVPGGWAPLVIVIGIAAFLFLPLVDRSPNPSRLQVVAQRAVGFGVFVAWGYLGLVAYLE